MVGMLSNILKNFVTKNATRDYPVKTRPGFKDARGELSIDIFNCTFCGICSKKCPSQCIKVERKELTWECDAYSCVFCGICVESCPKKCLVHDSDHKKPARYNSRIIFKGEKKEKKAA